MIDDYGKIKEDNFFEVISRAFVFLIYELSVSSFVIDCRNQCRALILKKNLSMLSTWT